MWWHWNYVINHADKIINVYFGLNFMQSWQDLWTFVSPELFCAVTVLRLSLCANIQECVCTANTIQNSNSNSNSFLALIWDWRQMEKQLSFDRQH